VDLPGGRSRSEPLPAPRNRAGFHQSLDAVALVLSEIVDFILVVAMRS